MSTAAGMGDLAAMTDLALEAAADLHQVHLNYHHMVDVAQVYRQALEFARDFKPISYASETAALRMYVEEVRRRATDALESPAHDQIQPDTEDA